ncbi:DEAD/DEAH box helicase domain-containing protein [Besnoitia besnoiti]|uniref:DEAD/DEAH box helicase domain-containing protein n=1 Tax=Besnoitia besnoiti TaxID=94643 RepID=A0A2A9M6T9_BESBE|nr:DEAD/DEAH box helicase domain-containing protein [Besnoitia besnoiti]PFH31606.1 DEAD/DEAH box helicase domain-containing protein [Besnoitia besnoiti]
MDDPLAPSDGYSAAAKARATKEQLLADQHESRVANSSDAADLQAASAREKDDVRDGAGGEARGGGGGEGLADDEFYAEGIAAVSMIEDDELDAPLRKLSWWAALLPQTRGEVMTELGGSYLFFIHGDSLILHLLRKNYVDLDVEQGVQPLVYIHLIEKQLLALLSAGAIFHLVFFRVFEDVAVGGARDARDSVPPVFLLIREQLLLHLAVMKIDFTVLDSWFSDDWKALMRRKHPTFLLIDDLHFSKEENGEPEEEEEEDEDAEEDEEEEEETAAWELPAGVPEAVVALQKQTRKRVESRGREWVSYLLQSLMLSSLSRNLHVAMMHGCIYKKTKAYCLAIAPTAAAALWVQLERRRKEDEDRRREEAHANQRTLEEALPSGDAEGDNENGEIQDFQARELMLKALEVYGELLLPAEKDEEDLAKEKEEETQLLADVRKLAATGDAVSSLRHLLAEKFCLFLRAIAAEEEEEGEGSEQVQQFLAVGKMLFLSATVMKELSVEERCHHTVSSKAPFITEYLYAPLKLYIAEATKTLRQLRSLYTTSPDVAEELRAAVLHPEEIADFFDGKLFFTLTAYACDFARSSSNWDLPASFFGLSPVAVERLSAAFASLAGAASGAESLKAFTQPLFPLHLAPLAAQLEAYPLPLPTPVAAEDEPTPHLLSAHNSFLLKFRAAGPDGALPFAPTAALENSADVRRREAEIRRKGREEDSGDEQEEAREELIDAVERDADATFSEPPPDGVLDFAKLQMNYLNSQEYTPTERELQRMEKMNGEQKRKHLDMLERKRKQQLQVTIRRKAKSLCPYPLHFPISGAFDERHPWIKIDAEEKAKEAEQAAAAGAGEAKTAAQKKKLEKEKKAAGKREVNGKAKEEAAKPLKKADLIRMKNAGALDKKVQNLDAERLADLERRLEALCAEYTALSSRSSLLSSFSHNGTTYSISAANLLALLLDVLVGPSRRMSLLLNFPYVVQLLKMRDAQRSFIMKVQRLASDAFAGFDKESINSKSHFADMQRLFCAVFRINVESFRLFKGELEGAEIEAIQRSLLSLGFQQSAERMFTEWKEKRVLHLAAVKEQEAEKAEQQMLLAGGGRGPKGKEKKAAKADKAGKKGDAASENKAKKDSLAALDVHRVSRAALFDFRVKKGFEAQAQLRFMGGDFQRTTGSRTKKDSRVLFTPDYWQVRLLDLIDRRESVFVTAPTSSGKTFICFYAMELVLRCPIRGEKAIDNDAVIVYVSPSKALADQVYAEVHGRFSSKTYSASGSGKFLAANFVERQNTEPPLNAQVIVTLPHILEMLLMSGAFARWNVNLRYVILDEIHCISEEEGGSQWERLIKLLPCPFLAMSATVGNPDSFLYWMRSANPSTPITHIDYKERFSDLHMVLYHEKKLLPLNPVCSVHYDKVKLGGLASDFYVPPNDGLSVYFMIRSLLGEKHPFSVEFFPEFYFEGCAAITKKQYRWYWNALRHALVDLVQTEGLTAAQFAEFQRGLQEEPGVLWTKELTFFENVDTPMAIAVRKAIAAHEEKKEAEKTSEEGEDRGNYLESVMEQTEFSKAYLDPDNLIALCRQLDAAERLPCLIFNFHRQEIRQMVLSMTKRLKQLQLDKYYGTEEAAYRTRLANKKRMEQYQAALAQREMEEKMRGLSWQQREAQGIGKDEGGSMEDEGVPPPPIDIAEEIDPEFSFASLKAMGTNFDDIKDILERLKRRAVSATDRLLVEALRRGIGVYDNGLPKAFREAVDILFRIGFLRICICSNALALGMNMPCRTSVFAGDSFMLTPTMFKQSGGRAGRRGYDAAGYILFWEIPFSKINRLLEARLPIFGGDFPVTPMLTLRTLRYHEQLEQLALEGDVLDAKSVERWEAALLRLYLCPLFAVSKDNTRPSVAYEENLRLYVRFQFRFMTDLLQRLGLLHDGRIEDGGGHGISLWGHMAELSYQQETASFLLHFLLFSGLLERQLASKRSEKARVGLLLHFLATCLSQQNVTSGQFLRHQLRHERTMARVRQEPGFQKGVSVASEESDVPQFRPFMALLPEEIEQAIQSYNEMAFLTSVRCMRAAGTLLAKRGTTDVEQGHPVPFSHAFFPRETPKAKEEACRAEKTADGLVDREASEFFSRFKELVRTGYIRSPYTAICCRYDSDFRSLAELQDCVGASTPFYPETMSAELPCNYTWLRYWDAKLRREVKAKVRSQNHYLLDLRATGTFRHVTRYDEISAGKIWFLIHDFVDTLMFLKRAPRECGDKNPVVRSVIENLHEAMYEIFEKESKK